MAGQGGLWGGGPWGLFGEEIPSSPYEVSRKDELIKSALPAERYQSWVTCMPSCHQSPQEASRQRRKTYRKCKRKKYRENQFTDSNVFESGMRLSWCHTNLQMEPKVHFNGSIFLFTLTRAIKLISPVMGKHFLSLNCHLTFFDICT